MCYPRIRIMDHNIINLLVLSVFYMDDNFIKEWDSLIELEREGFQKSNIINVCKNKRKSHRNYKWKFNI